MHRILKKEEEIAQLQAKLRLTEYEQDKLARIRIHYGFNPAYQLFQMDDFSAEMDASKAFPSYIASLIVMRFKLSVQAT